MQPVWWMQGADRVLPDERQDEPDHTVARAQVWLSDVVARHFMRVFLTRGRSGDLQIIELELPGNMAA